MDASCHFGQSLRLASNNALAGLDVEALRPVAQSSKALKSPHSLVLQALARSASLASRAAWSRSPLRPFALGIASLCMHVIDCKASLARALDCSSPVRDATGA